ncbi:MAG: hypothetical protein K9K21_12145 [Desulfotignum sp.]|nr:hypothetical protein [Desulfotignum sp.]MCF8139423.1 hypothetical protein [Desulfotignum sp.]
MAARAERIRFTILSEGLRDYYFVKSYLEAAFGKNKVECFRSQTVPGKGSGEQQVRNLFPMELAARRKRPREDNYWLMVITDGDRFSPEKRREQLAREAWEKKLPMAADKERVAVFVPCRNIESWFKWIDSGIVDESEDYKKEYRQVKPTKYAKELHKKCREQADMEFCPSLHDACEQWQKIVCCHQL